MKKVLKIMGKVLFGIVGVAYMVCAIFLTVCLLNYNDYNITELGDYSLVLIRDKELEPSYEKGDLVVVRRNENDDVKAGDNIFFYNTYQNEVSINLGKVVKTNKLNEKETTFTMQGDQPISSQYFVGRAATATTYSNLGSIISVLESRWGYLFLIVLPILLLFLYEIYMVIMEIKTPIIEEE